MFGYWSGAPQAAVFGTDNATRGRRKSFHPVAVLSLLSLCSSQDPGTRDIVVHNLAPVTREEWVSAVVPFSAGSVTDIPDLHVRGHATVWQPFGARWPDGSTRQALCFFRTGLDPLQEKVLPLAPGKGPDLRGGPPELPAFELEFQVRTPGASTRARPEPIEVLESNQARTVVLLGCRIGDTGLVGELIVTAYRDQPHAYADVAVFFSDPTTEAMQAPSRSSRWSAGAWPCSFGTPSPWRSPRSPPKAVVALCSWSTR